MQVSQIVKQNLLIDSSTYNSLSPNMKDAVKDVFSFYEQAKGNIVEKIDDTDFQATNPGVWCWSVRDLINEEHFTDWKEYKGDEIV